MSIVALGRSATMSSISEFLLQDFPITAIWMAVVSQSDMNAKEMHVFWQTAALNAGFYSN